MEHKCLHPPFQANTKVFRVLPALLQIRKSHRAVLDAHLALRCKEISVHALTLLVLQTVKQADANVSFRMLFRAAQ